MKYEGRSILLGDYLSLWQQSTHPDIAPFSEASLLNLLRYIDPNAGWRSGHTFFRKFRKGASMETVHMFFSLIQRHLHDRDLLTNVLERVARAISLNNYGDWCILYAIVEGLLRNDNPKVHDFLHFILQHAKAERDLIARTPLFHGKNTSAETLRFLSNFLSGTFESDLFENNLAKLQIRRVCYWSALVECYIAISTNSESSNRIPSKAYFRLNNALPTVVNGKLVRSVGIYTQYWKDEYAKQILGQERISWNDLYRNIAREKELRCGSTDIEVIDPDIETIKKRIQRWKKRGCGYTHRKFVNTFGRLVNPLKEPQNHLLHDPRLLFINLLQIFDLTQQALLKKKVSPAVIVDTFSHYPQTVDHVKQKYQRYLVTGTLDVI